MSFDANANSPQRIPVAPTYVPVAGMDSPVSVRVVGVMAWDAKMRVLLLRLNKKMTLVLTMATCLKYFSE